MNTRGKFVYCALMLIFLIFLSDPIVVSSAIVETEEWYPKRYSSAPALIMPGNSVLSTAISYPDESIAVYRIETLQQMQKEHQRLTLEAANIIYATDLYGDVARRGDLYNGLLWLASPEYTGIPDNTCWVIIAGTDVREYCIDAVEGIPMPIEDIRADWARGKLWALAQYDTSWNPPGGSYILEWDTDRWRIVTSISNLRWNVHRAAAKLMDVTSDGKIVALTYLVDDQERVIDTRLVIFDPSTKELVDVSIEKFGLPKDLPPSLTTLAVYNNYVLIGAVAKISETVFSVKLVAVDPYSLSHKNLLDVTIDAYAVGFTVLREPGRPKSYLLLTVIEPEGSLIMKVYSADGLVTTRKYSLPFQPEGKVELAEVSLLANSKYFYLALITYNPSTRYYDLYLIGDDHVWIVWSAGSLGSVFTAYMRQHDIVVLTAGLHPWKWGTGRLILVEDPKMPMSLALEELEEELKVATYRELLSYFTKLKRFYEDELNLFRDLIVRVLKASRADEDILEAIAKYEKGEYSKDAAARAIGGAIIEMNLNLAIELYTNLAKKLAEKYGYYELAGFVEVYASAVNVAMLAPEIANYITDIVHLTSNETRLRAVANVYVLSLMYSEKLNLVDYIPFKDCLKEVRVVDDRIELIYDEEMLRRKFEELILKLDSNEIKLLLEYVRFLNENLDNDLHYYPLWSSVPFEWYNKIVNDIDRGITIAKILMLAYTVSATLTSYKVPWFEVIDVFLSRALEVKEEEMKVVAVNSILVVAQMNLEARLSYIHEWLGEGSIEYSINKIRHNRSFFESYLNHMKELKNTVNSLGDTIKVSSLYDKNGHLRLKLYGCHIEANYSSEFLDFGFYMAPLDTLERLIMNIRLIEKHEVKLICSHGIHKSVTLDLDVKPSINIIDWYIKLTPLGIELGLHIKVLNPYPFQINISTIGYLLLPPPFKKLELYSETITIPAGAERVVSIPVMLVPLTMLVPPYIGLPLFINYDLLMNNALLLRASLRPIGSFVLLTELKHKLYLSIIDEEGRVVGYKEGNVMVEIPGAQFIDLGNLQVAYIPINVSSFRVLVDASDAREVLEEYNLSIVQLQEDVSRSIELRATIEKGNIHELRALVRNDVLIIEPINIESFEVISSNNSKISTITTPTPTASTPTPLPHRELIIYTVGALIIIVVLVVILVSKKRK